MTVKELIQSFIDRGTHVRTEEVKYFDREVVTVKRTTGWISKKQFDFLMGIDKNNEVRVSAGEGGFYSKDDVAFYIKRGMPNAARSWSSNEILSKRPITEADWNLSNY